MSSTPNCLNVRARALFCLMLLLLIAAGCAPGADKTARVARTSITSPKGVAEIHRKTREAGVDKTAWVVRTNITSPQGVAEICREAREAGFDSLVVQVRGRGDAYYRSTLAPPAAGLASVPADFDPLAAALDNCRPLPVHAWLNVYLLWSGAKSPKHPRHPAQPGFDWFLEDADGRSVADYSMLDRSLGWLEGIYADPASPKYREHFTQVVAEVVQRYQVAGVHLDFVRYPGVTYGQGGPLGERFENKWGLNARFLPMVGPEKVKAWLAGNLPLHDRVLTTAGLLWAEARAAQITELVRAVKQMLLESRRPVPLSAAISPEAGAAYLDKGQDWRAWAAAGLVDALYPMAYFGGPERVAGQLQEIQSVQRDGIKVWAGLGGYIKEPAVIAGEAAEARRLGFDGISLFDLGTLMKKPGGSRPYVEAIAGSRPPFAPRPMIAREPAAIAPLAASSSEVVMLKAIVAKALGGVLPQQPDLDAAIGRRWAEFAAARPLFGKINAAMAREPQLMPGWIELQGIFRYINPLDGPAKREEQMAKILQARARLTSGEKFAVVAREMSQGGTKNQGGVLNRRWLTEGSPDSPLAAMAVGDLSPVVEVGNGLWCYQLLAKGEPALLPLAEIPWPARRLLFRQHLARALAGKK